MTCKDCAHYGICYRTHLMPDVEDDAFENGNEFCIKFKDKSKFIESEKIFNVIQESLNHFSHFCKTQKEAKEETCRYEGVLYVKQKLKEQTK